MKGRAINLVALLGLVLLAACGGDDGQANDAGEAAPAGEQAAAEFGIGKPAPDFTLTDIHGNEVSLSGQRGKAVVVDFWATWCGPCRVVMPHLQELSEEYADQLAVLAVSLDQNPRSAVPPFAEKHGLTFTMLADKRSPAVAQQWGGIRSIPTSFLISPDGTVVHRWVGVHAREEYEKEIRKALGMES